MVDKGSEYGERMERLRDRRLSLAAGGGVNGGITAAQSNLNVLSAL